ncbi:hypothetical protein SLS57_005406 [Botryosphaeria dothidea]
MPPGERGAFNARPVEPCDPSELDPGDEEAARCLHNYQTFMSKYFPFVIVAPDVTVATLRETKPFLFKAIVVVASVQDLGRQRALGYALMGELTNKLLIRGERSVDLLQGILVWLAWYTTNLLQLAVGLVIDLGLKRTARAFGKERLDNAIARSAHGQLANSELRTSDERRALLGCFYLTTIVSQWAKRYDSLRYNAQLAEVCRNLEEAQELPSDRFLVYLVRLQRIVQRIERKVPIDDFTAETMIPIAMFVKALHSELEEFKESLPADVAENGKQVARRPNAQIIVLNQILADLLWMHYYSAEVYLYEISLSSLPNTTQYGDFAYRRLEMLNGLMQAAKAFMDLYHNHPTASYINVSFIQFSQLTSTIIVLSKLTRLECPGWDLEYAKEFIDFGGQMLKTAALYEEARTISEVPLNDNPLLTFFARKLRFIKAWNDAKMKGSDPGPEVFEAQQRAAAEGERGDGPAAGEGSAEAATVQQVPEAAAKDTANPRLNVNVGGEPMQLEDISQDHIFDQLDPSFWQEWATGDLTMWDADSIQQTCFGFDGMGGGFS